MLVLILLGCTLQESSEETFHQIEETIVKAKTLRVSFTFAGPEKTKVKGTMLFREGGSFKLTTTTSRGTEDEELNCVCDGIRMSRRKGGSDPILSEVAESRRGLAAMMFARLGASMTSVLWESAPDVDLTKAFAPKDLKAGKDDGEAKTLLYTVTVPTALTQEKMEFYCKLWYDPTSYKLFKRTLSIRKGDALGGFLENYTQFVLNEPIPDDTFRIEDTKRK